MKQYQAISTSAFPDACVRLVDSIESGTLDYSEFSRPLSRCEGECAGSCCYDGTYVEPDEETVLGCLLDSNRDFFGSLGIDIEIQRFVPSRWPEPGTQTALAPRPDKFPPDTPDHFKTGLACFLLLDDGRCSLEVFARAHGLHRWHYKPMCCWTYPIIVRRGGHPEFRLYSEVNDPYACPDYPGFVNATKCSATTPLGRPAREVLCEELSYMCEILDQHPHRKAIEEILEGTGRDVGA